MEYMGDSVEDGVSSLSESLRFTIVYIWFESNGTKNPTNLKAWVSGNNQRTDTISVRASSPSNSVTFTLPQGVHCTTASGNDYTGEVTLQANTDFYLWTTQTTSGTYATGDVHSNENDFSTYVIRRTDDKQDVAFGSFSPSNTTTHFSVDWLSNGQLSLAKVSEKPEITNGNACYSLKDAIYDVYAGNKAEGTPIGSMTTDENGCATYDNLVAGAYTVKERTASPGYTLDPKAYTVEVKAGQTAEIRSVEPVGMDPMSIVIKKVNNGEEVSEIVSLEGTQFTVKYYDTLSDTLPSTPKRTWILEVKREERNGKVLYRCGLSDTYKVGGDDFYMDNNMPSLPVGTIVVEETKSAEGYTTEGGFLKDANGNVVSNSTTYKAKITQRGDLTRLEGGNEYTMINYAVAGDVVITKADFEDQITGAQGGATLAGAEFSLINVSDHAVIYKGKAYNPGETLLTVTTDENFSARVEKIPYGDYKFVETKAPEGYIIEGELEKYFSVREDGKILTLPPIKDKVIRGGVRIQKRDIETGKDDTQGNANFENTEFSIYNNGKNPVLVGDKIYKSGECVAVIYADKSGIAATGADLLPYGNYTIKETKNPEGYLLEGTLEQSFKIAKNGVMVELGITDANTTIKDQIIRGGVKVQKRDIETGNIDEQGNANFEGTEFSIYNDSEKPVIVDGKSYDLGVRVATIYTDANGVAATAADFLPYGSYVIKETKNPEGYLLEGVLEQSFEIKENGVIVELGVNDTDTAIMDQIIRGGVRVQKRDIETDRSEPQNNASLEHAEFSIFNDNEKPVIVKGEAYERGDCVAVIYTDENGIAATEADCLPYGSYIVKETQSPTGYLLEGILEQSFKIEEDGVIVDLGINDDETAIKDQIMRGDFEFIKMDEDTQNTMAGIQFKVTSKYSGESHIITTDENGFYSSKEVPHSHNTNNGGAGDGLWFGEGSADDSKGALPFGVYLIEEIKGENNKDKVMFSGTLTIRKDNYRVSLGVIANKTIDIGTVATEEVDGTHYAAAEKNVTIKDTVTYRNLTIGKEYTMKGVLMNRSTGKEVLDKDGKPVTSEVKFTPYTDRGVVEVFFTFDASNLGGQDVVVFETVYDANGDFVTEHADIKDDGQTVHIPSIGTKATDEVSGSNMIHATENMTIIDTVSYKNLQTGVEYTVKGTLMDKATGEAVVDKDGQAITSEVKFVPETADGTVDVKFVFDGTHLAGKTLVAFESVKRGDKVYAVHADINDEDQTVYVPGLKTTATDIVTKDHIANPTENVVITDVVEYKNLIPGKEYTVNGVLMSKETGEAILVDGKEVTSEKTFVAESADGTVELTFTLNASELKGTTLVVFESVSYNNHEVATHTDINDEAQSVRFPDMKTSAKDADDLDSWINPDSEATIIDTVSYKNLTPGRVYKITGVLMDKKTGERLLVNGSDVTAETTFTAETADGDVDVTFTLNASNLEGRTLVVFEKMYLVDAETSLIGTHEDINDTDQTIHVLRKEVPAVQTGDRPIAQIMFAMLAFGAIALVTAVSMKRRKQF